ncbi:hypothetical protein COL154_009316 [Colletotrichum chrysophilum]|nr:hypothetical protein COL154_009316 [Colletotrichum chrysophilum]
MLLFAFPTTLVHPYARLVRLLDTNTPATPLPAVQREFTELCTLGRALAIPAGVCHDIVDLLDGTSVHLARELQGNGGGGEGVWNSTAEGIFRAVTAQLPNWWDDHNALAVPLQSALESLRQARGMEGDVLGAFKLAVGSLDPNTFPAEDVFYAYDRLFTPLLPRRDALLTTLESATRMLEDAAGRVYDFNATLHGIRAEAKEGTRGACTFEGLEVLLGRVKDALALLDYELEAVGVRQRQRLRDGEGGEEEARDVEERRPRRRREREERDREERERGRKAWWKL